MNSLIVNLRICRNDRFDHLAYFLLLRFYNEALFSRDPTREKNAEAPASAGSTGRSEADNRFVREKEVPK